MNIAPWLNITTAQVGRITTTADGMGATSSATTLTTLGRVAIWQAGSGDQSLSDKIAQASTHVMVLETPTYAWTSADTTITYAGDVYNITGRPDDVEFQERITVVGLELIS